MDVQLILTTVAVGHPAVVIDVVEGLNQGLDQGVARGPVLGGGTVAQVQEAGVGQGHAVIPAGRGRGHAQGQETGQLPGAGARAGAGANPGVAAGAKVQKRKAEARVAANLHPELGQRARAKADLDPNPKALFREEKKIHFVETYYTGILMETWVYTYETS